MFSYFEPCIFTGLLIKDCNPSDSPDFLCSEIIGAVDAGSSSEFLYKCDAMQRGESMPVDFSGSGREGYFDDNQLYAIYERADVEQLIDRLRKTLL